MNSSLISIKIKKRLYLLFLACLPILFFHPNAYGKNKTKASYVGTQTCEECHPHHYDTYIKTVMGNPNVKNSPAEKFGCETCHGPGSLHVDSQGMLPGGLITFSPKEPAKIKDAVCLKCHETGARALWEGSDHEVHGLSCMNCHKMHQMRSLRSSKLETAILYQLRKDSISATCYQCHNGVKDDFLKFSHHPVPEGKITCTDCHDPHGSFAPHLLAAVSINELCYKCHASKRGPYLWIHPPVEEDCLDCHTPHGSPNRDLLTEKLPFLCQRCHDSAYHPSTLYAVPMTKAGQPVYQAVSIQGVYYSCFQCHPEIHGSSSPSGMYFQR